MRGIHTCAVFRCAVFIGEATDRLLEELNRQHDSVVEMMQQMDQNHDGFVSISEVRRLYSRGWNDGLYAYVAGYGLSSYGLYSNGP